jgi:hypothetical protein
MKNFPFALLALATGATLAQSQPSATSNSFPSPVEFVTINQMPVPVPPSELQKHKRVVDTKAEDGFSTSEMAPLVVRQFLSNVDIVTGQAGFPETFAEGAKSGLVAPEVVHDLSKLKLGFKAATVHQGELIGATPYGTIVNEAWTGVERYYRIIGAGTMRLIESDMKVTGGKFYMLKDAINTQVAGQPAISKIFRDEGGRIIEEVLWVSEQKLHMLTFAPDMEPGRYGLTKSNFRLSAVSLAQELR